jgi:signal transduction histidine kinase
VSIPELELNPQMGGTGEFISMIVSIMQAPASELVAISMVNITESVLTRRRLEASQAEQARLLNELTIVNQQLNERNRELVQSNDALQVSNEELVLTQEELQASIEEFETTNEELQAANEELETTNEETQAINEELQTNNHELNARTLQLQETTFTLKQEQERLRQLSRQLLDTQEIEKRALALELHDQLGQELTVLGQLLDASMQNPSKADQQLVQARTLTTNLLHRVSQLALDLRPSMLDDLGLVPTVRWYCEKYTSQTQIQVKITSYTSDERFSSRVEIAAYRIIQEALTNVARHADVKTVYLEIQADAEALYLRIKDTGRGFNLERQTELHSTGLSSMHERANLLDGELTITTAPGKGTEIMARLPLNNM